MRVLGLDIGGANLKASDADGHTTVMPFAMWQQHQQLTAALQALAAKHAASLPTTPADSRTPDMIALTLTAELADCFQTKAEGVEFIIGAVQSSFPEVPLRVWLTSGEFAEPHDARELATLVAAANWHALATWIGRAVPDGPALLIDMGSTTTDIIPLLDGLPIPAGLNDPDRLLAGELVYTGAARTPVCAIVDTLPLRGRQCPVAAEVFATMADACVVAGLTSENIHDTNTADGRPLTREHAQNRLAHMCCCDATGLTEDDLQQMALQILNAQMQQVQTALHQVLDRLANVLQAAEHRSLEIEKPMVIVSGSGAFLILRLLQQADNVRFAGRLTLSDMFRQPISDSACAFAVARLAHDRCRDDLLELNPL